MASMGEATLELHLKAYQLKFEREVRLIPSRRWRWDFLVKDLAIEIQGGTWSAGRHSRGAGQRNDAEKLNAVVRAGYRPLVFTTGMVTDGTAIEVIKEALCAKK